MDMRSHGQMRLKAGGHTGCFLWGGFRPRLPVWSQEPVSPCRCITELSGLLLGIGVEELAASQAPAASCTGWRNLPPSGVTLPPAILQSEVTFSQN